MRLGLKKGYLMMLLGSRVMQSKEPWQTLLQCSGVTWDRPYLKASVSPQAEKGDKRNLAGLFCRVRGLDTRVDPSTRGAPEWLDRG